MDAGADKKPASDFDKRMSLLEKMLIKREASGSREEVNYEILLRIESKQNGFAEIQKSHTLELREIKSGTVDMRDRVYTLEKDRDLHHNRIKGLEDDAEKVPKAIDDVIGKMESHLKGYVTQSEFNPVRMIAYGFAGTVLGGFALALVAFFISG